MISANPKPHELFPDLIRDLGRLEARRDGRWARRSSSVRDSLYWKARSFRHINHILPGQSILELGAGQGAFTRELYEMSGGLYVLTALVFGDRSPTLADLPVEVADPESLAQRQFDLAVGIDLLNGKNFGAVFQYAHSILKPGGRLVMYQKNTRHPLRRLMGVGRRRPAGLPHKKAVMEILSEIGFIRIQITQYDFAYGPLAGIAPRLLRNLTVLLENMPVVRHLSDSILILVQKPPKQPLRPRTSLFTHPSLRGAFSVVIPCHNEEMNILPLVLGIKDLYGDYLCEIIPVDDNSRDGTAGVLRRLAEKDPLIRPVFRTPPNGVGRAIRDGLGAARGRFVLTMDCDFQHLLPELKDLFDAAAQGYDVVVGSRFSRHSVLLNYPFTKIVANRGFHLLAKRMLGRNFRDLTNNLKVFRRPVVDDLNQALTQTGFSVNAETGFLPLLMGYSVKEVPISWINRTPDMGVSSFRLVRVGSGYLGVLWDLCRKTRFGRRLLPSSRGSARSAPPRKGSPVPTPDE